jgi:hypothetical protein
MNIIYKNETSQTLNLAMAAVGVVLASLAALDYFAIWPLFGANQHLDIALLLAGSLLALAGFKLLSSLVREIAVDGDGRLVLRRPTGSLTISGNELEAVSLFGAANKQQLSVLLSTARGSWSFPMAPFAAERFIETIKAINPAARVDRHA